MNDNVILFPSVGPVNGADVHCQIQSYASHAPPSWSVTLTPFTPWITKSITHIGNSFRRPQKVVPSESEDQFARLMITGRWLPNDFRHLRLGERAIDKRPGIVLYWCNCCYILQYCVWYHTNTHIEMYDLETCRYCLFFVPSPNSCNV